MASSWFFYSAVFFLFLKIHVILQSNITSYCIKYISELCLKENDKYVFRLPFFKPSSGCNCRIFQYKIDTALRYNISFT